MKLKTIINNRITEIYHSICDSDLVDKLIEQIEKLKPTLIERAQKIYSQWEQNEEGEDEYYGSGGICDDIADEFCKVFSNYNLPCTTIYNEYDYHTSAYVYDEHTKTLIKVDIPPHVYESGAGYNWTKKQDVSFSSDDIIVEDMSDMYDEIMSEE